MTVLRYITFCYTYDTVFYAFVLFHYGLATILVRSVATTITTGDDSTRWTTTRPRLLAVPVRYIRMLLRLAIALHLPTNCYIGLRLTVCWRHDRIKKGCVAATVQSALSVHRAYVALHQDVTIYCYDLLLRSRTFCSDPLYV